MYSNLKINIKTQIQWIHLNSNQNTMKILQITKENQSQMQGNSLSGAIAQYLGVLDPGLSVTTTNSAPIPKSLTRMARRDANNIHNYHSRSDTLTRINIGGLMYHSMVGKHIFLENGVSTFEHWYLLILDTTLKKREVRPF